MTHQGPGTPPLSYTDPSRPTRRTTAATNPGEDHSQHGEPRRRSLGWKSTSVSPMHPAACAIAHHHNYQLPPPYAATSRQLNSPGASVRVCMPAYTLPTSSRDARRAPTCPRMRLASLVHATAGPVPSCLPSISLCVRLHCSVACSPAFPAPQLHTHPFSCPLIAYLRPHLRPHPRGCTPTCLLYACSPVYKLQPHTGWQLY